MLIYTYLFWLSQISDGLIFYPQLKIYKNEKLYHVTNTQDLSHIQYLTLYLMMSTGLDPNCMTKELTSTFKLLTSHSFVATFHPTELICSTHLDLLDRWLLLMNKLLMKVFMMASSKSSLQTFSGQHHELLCSVYLTYETESVFIVVIYFHSFYLIYWIMTPE